MAPGALASDRNKYQEFSCKVKKRLEHKVHNLTAICELIV
jgi:hypothetical protein